ncbi:MAG: hypothetical protein AAF456_19020 [Planctomycetota bacterium]
MVDEITRNISTGVSIRLRFLPPTVPYVPDEAELESQQCPHCSRVITIEDAGVTFCPHCRHLLFTDDECRLLSPDLGSVTCPDCGAFIDLDGDVNPSLSEFCFRGIAADLFCRDCGSTVQWDHAVQTDFHFRFPIHPD